MRGARADLKASSGLLRAAPARERYRHEHEVQERRDEQTAHDHLTHRGLDFIAHLVIRDDEWDQR
jgi:hypothetical protein